MREPKDHDVDVGTAVSSVEEPLGGTEEQGAVEAVDHDVVAQEPASSSPVIVSSGGTTSA